MEYRTEDVLVTEDTTGPLRHPFHLVSAVHMPTGLKESASGQASLLLLRGHVKRRLRVRVESHEMST